MADDKKKGGKFPESFIAIIIIIIVMYFVVGGGLTRGGNSGDGEVLSGDGVTRAVPASGNLTPQADYHQND